jgi:hypothetical protein
MAWSTLYELTKLDDEAFKQAVGSGVISQRTTLDDARALRYTPRTLRGPVSDPSRTVLNIVERRDKASPPAPHLKLVADDDDHQPSALPTISLQGESIFYIARLVGDLKAEVERGEVEIDAAFSMSARSAAEKLLAMADQYGSPSMRRQH